MPPAPPGKRSFRPAIFALQLAWLVLLAGLAAAAGYVLVLPDGQRHFGATSIVVALGPPAAIDSDEAMPPAPAAVAQANSPEPAVAPPEPVVAAPPPKMASTPPQWQRNSEPFDDADARPRIAVVLTGLGLASAETEAAIDQLPPAVTLSFTPYARQLDQWVARARAKGHETMLDLPMEPTSYPDDDPGPQALLTALSPAQNLERLNWTLQRVGGYVGVAAVMGSRFTTSESALMPILTALKEQDLIFLDNRSSEDSIAGRLAAKIGVSSAMNDRALDAAQPSRVAVESRLVQIEGIAREQGFAVAMGRPYPVTLERLREWAKGLPDRGFALAPISAVVDRQRYHRDLTQSTKVP